MNRKPRLAVVVSHPIQYYAPYYRAIAEEGSVQIKAFFCSRIGLGVRDPEGMGVEISWATDLLSGYDHVFLPEAPNITRTTFKTVDNPSVTQYLDEFQPDVLLVHGYAQKTLVRALIWARRRGIPVMTISDRSFFGRTTLARRAARRLVLPLILKQFSAFLLIGDSIDKFYSSFGARPKQIFRVPNMLDDVFWRARDRRAQEREVMRAELGLRDRDFAVLYVGKFYSTKRPDDLVAALEVLAARKTLKRPVTVMFAGDGETRAALETRARAAGLPARFLGFVNIDRLPKVYCAADALAHPASKECYGTITVEAAVCGLPLVLSDRVGAIGPTSIARPGENTLVYPCADIEALADAIERLANEPETAERLSRASLHLSEDHDGRMSVVNTLRAVGYCLNGAVRARVPDAIGSKSA